MANPFTKEDRDKVTSTLKMITEAKKDIAKAKLAGIDVSDQEVRLSASETALLKIKQVYFSSNI